MRKSAPERSGRKLSLKRPGSRAEKNSRRESRVRSKPTVRLQLPLDRLKSWMNTGAALSSLLIFCALICVALVYGYRFLTSSAYFALGTVEIHGNSYLDSREILKLADLVDGGNILALSIDSIEENLSRNPWIEEISVKRVLPERLVIGIREKKPAFWLLREGTLYYTDALGRIIAPVAAGKIAYLPTLEVESGAEDARAALPDLLKSLKDSELPLDMASVSLVRLSPGGGVEVYIEDRRLKISIGLEEWLPNLQRLGRTLTDLGRRGEMPDVREIRAQGANVWVEKAVGRGTGT